MSYYYVLLLNQEVYGQAKARQQNGKNNGFWPVLKAYIYIEKFMMVQRVCLGQYLRYQCDID